MGVHTYVSVKYGDNKFMSIELDEDNKLVKIHQMVYPNEPKKEVDSIYFVKYADLRAFSLLLPASVRGIGGNKYSVHVDVLDSWKTRLNEVLGAIFKLEFENENKNILDFKKIMQAMRLLQLAHLNHEEDFDLSFSLLIAGTEAIANVAIPTEKIEKHPSHGDWKKLYKNCAPNADKIKELFEEYTKVRQYVNDEIKHRNLTSRFVEFIFKYCPVDEWTITTDDDLRNGFVDGPSRFPYDRIRSMTEIKIEKFNEKQLRNFVRDTYGYRSGFFHVGTGLPHRFPEGNTTNRYFEEVSNEKEWKKLREKMKREDRNTLSHEEHEKTKHYLINHDLMKTIARTSIFNYLTKTVKL